MQETVARVPAQERIVHVARDGVGWAPRDTAPVGIIFHVARCGSTLISQSLKRLDDLVVYAEPQPVNEILAPPHKWPRADLVAALRTLGGAFARHARGPYVLKLSSWNTLYCDIVAEAFPRHAVGPQPARPGRSRRVAAREPARMVPGHGGGGSRPRSAGGSGTRREIARRVRRARLRRVLRGGRAPRRQPRAAGAVRIAAGGRVGHRRAALLAVDRSCATRPHRRGGAAACKGADRNGRGVHFRRRAPSRPPHRPGFAGRSTRWRARNWSASFDSMVDEAWRSGQDACDDPFGSRQPFEPAQAPADLRVMGRAGHRPGSAPGCRNRSPGPVLWSNAGAREMPGSARVAPRRPAPGSDRRSAASRPRCSRGSHRSPRRSPAPEIGRVPRIA